MPSCPLNGIDHAARSPVSASSPQSRGCCSWGVFSLGAELCRCVHLLSPPPRYTLCWRCGHSLSIRRLQGDLLSPRPPTLYRVYNYRKPCRSIRYVGSLLWLCFGTPAMLDCRRGRCPFVTSRSTAPSTPPRGCESFASRDPSFQRPCCQMDSTKPA